MSKGDVLNGMGINELPLRLARGSCEGKPPDSLPTTGTEAAPFSSK